MAVTASDRPAVICNQLLRGQPSGRARSRIGYDRICSSLTLKRLPAMGFPCRQSRSCKDLMPMIADAFLFQHNYPPPMVCREHSLLSAEPFCETNRFNNSNIIINFLFFVDQDSTLTRETAAHCIHAQPQGLYAEMCHTPVSTHPDPLPHYPSRNVQHARHCYRGRRLYR